MAPKKGTAHVAKPENKPRKSATTAAATRDTAKADGDLYFMWLCFKNSQVRQVNYQTLANALGITKSAAKQRYYKIKNHFEALEAAAQAAQGEDPEIKSQPEEEQDELPEYKSEGQDDDLKVKLEELEGSF